MTWERQQAYAYRDGKDEGIAIGLAEGSRAAKLEAARHLLSLRILTEEQIAKAQGLTVTEVQEQAAERC